MSLGTKILLNNKLKSLSSNKRRDFLLNCIHQHKTETFNIFESDVDIININKSVCKVCKADDFIRDKYQEICNQCGFVRPLISSQPKFEKTQYIKPNSNYAIITKDSKQIKVDLNKINKWLEDTDPFAADIKKIINNLNIIYNSKSMELPMIVQNNSISLFYNFKNLYENYNGKYKQLYNKNAILALCIYYAASFNKNIISIEQLSLLFNINVNTIKNTNVLFKHIFENTDYYPYLTLDVSKQCNVQLSNRNEILFNLVKNHLLINKQIKLPINNKQYAGIIYFITNNFNTDQKYKLDLLQKTCDVSTTSISEFNKSIKNFYKKNTNLYEQLTSNI